MYLTYTIPWAAGEFKTKPTQHSTKELRGTGIIPDMVVICRSELPINQSLKINSHFCDVEREAVINTPLMASSYLSSIDYKPGKCRIL